MKEIYDSGIRLHQTKPDVKITKKPFGGVGVGTSVKLKWLDVQTIKDMAKELGMHLERSPSLNLEVEFIEGLKELVLEKAKQLEWL